MHRLPVLGWSSRFSREDIDSYVGIRRLEVCSQALLIFPPALCTIPCMMTALLVACVSRPPLCCSQHPLAMSLPWSLVGTLTSSQGCLAFPSPDFQHPLNDWFCSSTPGTLASSCTPSWEPNQCDTWKMLSSTVSSQWALASQRARGKRWNDNMTWDANAEEEQIVEKWKVPNKSMEELQR